MNIGVLSINYKNTPLPVREKVRFTRKNYSRTYQLFKRVPLLSESVILSTCNRTEIYFIFKQDKFDETLTEIEKILLEVFVLEENYLQEYIQWKRGPGVIKYLFEIATGLHSQVIGEQQILGQVKDAQKLAIEYAGSGKYLNKIFRESITTAKKIRDKTGLSDKNLSISSVAVNFIEDKLPDLPEKKALIIGVGEVSRIVLELLQDKGINKIYATNRTHGKVVNITEHYQGVTPVKYSRLEEIAAEVDIIISSTAAPHYILHAEKFEKYYSPGVNLVILDLAVPRDIEPDIGDWSGVSLINMDLLSRRVKTNKEYRFSQIEKAESLITEGLNLLKEWLCWQEVVPVIKKIKKCNNQIINEEISKLGKRIEIEEKDRREITKFAAHLEKKLFNRIILNLKDIARKQEGNYLDIIHKIFSDSDQETDLKNNMNGG